MSNQYDVVVIGAGPGGYVSAIRSAQLGKKVAIVEKQWLGGVCLNVGCIPSKALLKNAEVAHLLHKRGKEFGFKFDNLQLDFEVAFKRSRKVSDRLTKGIGFLMKKNGVDVYDGTGRIAGRNQVEVSLNDGGDGEVVELNAGNIIIATGARPRTLPGLEPNGDTIITYQEAIMRDQPPQSAILLGGGAIGVEFAYIWANYGVDVTIVELMERLVPNEEPEVSAILEKAYKRLGITVKTGTSIESVETDENQIKATLRNGDVIEAETLLVAVSFSPNVENLGLEDAGIQLTDNGHIAINDHMQTNVPNIYAIGDCATMYKLAHIGSAMGMVAAETIAGHATQPLDYRMMPRATYCVPQIASFGYTEAQAREAGYELNIGQFPFQPNGKALGLGEREGFVKIIADAKYGEILGAHMVGPDVTELLPELTLAHHAELTAEEIAGNVHAHPTLGEVIMEAAHAVEGTPIHI